MNDHIEKLKEYLRKEIDHLEKSRDLVINYTTAVERHKIVIIAYNSILNKILEFAPDETKFKEGEEVWVKAVYNCRNDLASDKSFIQVGERCVSVFDKNMRKVNDESK